ncbi:MAG: TadE/TadG family type IV pilus assembly protein [Nocardioidaceae bacterium]
MINAYASRRQRRRSGERGAVAVEAALVTPVLFLILFGIIEFGFVFKDYLSVTSATRAGARTASAEPRVPGTSGIQYAQDAANSFLREAAALQMSNIQELWVYKADSNGYPVGVGNFSSCTTCVKFTVSQSWGGPPPAPTTVNGWYANSTYSNWPALSQNACAGDPNRDSVGIYVKYSHPAITGLIFNTFTLEDHTVMALEPVPITSTCRP